MTQQIDFGDLTPDLLLNSVEKETGLKMTGFTSPLPSYINRVYELETIEGERIIAKFYRPGRWKKEALLDEHNFIFSCDDAEIPVVVPDKLLSGSTLGDADGIYFAIFPKKHGREMELTCDEDYIRIGTLIARIHVAAASKKAEHRIVLNPDDSTRIDVEHLLSGNYMSGSQKKKFSDICNEIINLSSPLFKSTEYMRIHGDCHLKNIINRPDEGLMIIDFDDMMTAPPVQDLWLLLPDHLNNARKEVNLLLEGYEKFRNFDMRTLKLIEPLRAMRIIYYLSWCATQYEDYRFRNLFPDWGSERFWMKENSDLEKQLAMIKVHLNSN